MEQERTKTNDVEKADKKNEKSTMVGDQKVYYGKNNNLLISFSDMSPEKHREISRKGGIRSGQVQLEKMKNKQMLEYILNMTVKDPKLMKKAKKTGFISETQEITYRFLINLMAVHNSLDKFAYYKDIVDRTDGRFDDENIQQSIKVELSPELKEWSK